MITYNYKCSVCQHTIEVRQSIKDKPLQKCPACNQHSLERVIYGGLGFNMDREPTTLGQQAERNAKKMGKTKVQELDAQKPPDPLKQNEQQRRLEKVLDGGQERIRKYIWEGK